MDVPPVTSAKANKFEVLPTLSAKTAFALQASITFGLLAGSSAPTPLYPIYQTKWGFSAITMTLVFGVYAVAVLVALLTVGRLSDHVGRRPVLMASTLASALAMCIFGTASGELSLYIGRLVQGLATGAAVAAVGAGLIDLNRARGTVANALAPITGTATGGLVAGLMVHFLPFPTHLIYGVLGVIFLLQCVGVLFMAESVNLRPGAVASLRPQFAVPAHIKRSMLTAAPILIAAWGLAGFYASLGPALIRSVFLFDASLFGGIALFIMVGSGAVTVLLLIQRAARPLMTTGSIGLLVGTSLVMIAIGSRSVVVFFVGSAFAGAGFGAGFQGAIRSVVPLAAPNERASVLSVVFVVSYLAMGLPSVIAGIALSRGLNIGDTSQYFGSAVFGLAVLALVGARLNHKR